LSVDKDQFEVPRNVLRIGQFLSYRGSEEKKMDNFKLKARNCGGIRKEI
jgi:hypothetical protein